MALRVEFDHAGRTYAIESASINMWNVHAIARMNSMMTIETDVLTGEEIFVTWSQIGVIRLVSPVNEEGFAAD